MASRAAGSALGMTTDVSNADGSAQRHVWSGSRLGVWNVSWPDAWLGDDEAITHLQANGCGVCDIVRIDAGSGVTESLLHGMSARNFVVGPAGQTAAVAAWLSPDDEGVHILALDGSGTHRVHDTVCSVARWDADGLPYVWLPTHGKDQCGTTAFGPDGLMQAIDVPEDLANASVSPTGRWRVLYGDSGWRLYDRESRVRAVHGSDPTDRHPYEWCAVDTVSWHPEETALYWLASGRLWVAELPDGEARLVAEWPRLPAWRPDIDVAWLQP